MRRSFAMLMGRILRTVELPFLVDGHKLFVSCSIGLSFYPKGGDDFETLLKNADAAMHRAKDKGRNNFQFYTPAMNQRVTERLSLESRLPQALLKNEFVLHYQPKVGRLRMDHSFVRDIRADPNDAIIARAVISLGHSLGMSVITEGIANREQLAFLKENDCDEMQGFLFSMPFPVEESIVLLPSNRTLSMH